MEPQNTNTTNQSGHTPVTAPVPQVQTNATQPTPTLTATPQPVLSPNPTNPPQQQPPRQLTEKAEKLKKLSIHVMIAGLIGAATLAVIAVLAGSFNETFQKALFTLFVVIIHALASLGFVEQTGKVKNSGFKFFENVFFSIIVLSFFTSIFGIWQFLNGEIIARLYGTYFILLFASLHGQMLVETRGKQSSIDTIVNVNYVLMSLVVLLILPLIWTTDANFPGIYYRLLAACGIIDGTLTILAVILHKLYVQKHPEVQSTIFSTPGLNPVAVDSTGQVVVQKRHTHPLILLLGIFIIGQFVISLLFAVLGAFYR